MIRHILLIASRKFKSRLLINSFNLIGLTAGFSIFILLGIYYLQETNYETGFSDSENIYRINTQFLNAKRTASSSTNLLYSFDNAPEVLGATHIKSLPAGTAKIGSKTGFSSRILRIDTGFFKVFDFELVHGYLDSKRLPEQTVLITESFALENFGTVDLIGKELLIGENKLEVFDIVLPEKKGTHLQFDLLVVKPIPEYSERAWVSLNKGATYMKTIHGNSVDQLNDRLLNLAKDQIFPSMSRLFSFRKDYSVGEWIASGNAIYNFVQPVEDIHLDKPLVGEERLSVSRNVINTFGTVAILILVVSSLNFIHFTTAKVTLRMKEVGVKRTLGSSREILVFQLLIETFLWTFTAVILAVGSVEIILKIIENSHQDLFHISLNDVPYFLTLLVLIILGVGLVSAIYPSMYLTRTKVARSLRASSSFNSGISGGHTLFKKSIVVFQFAIASIQIIACVFMTRQATFMQHFDLGFQAENALVIDASDFSTQERTVFQQRLSGLSTIRQVTSFSELPGNPDERIGINVKTSEGFDMNLKWIQVNGSLLNSLSLNLIEGKRFDQVQKTDVAIINLRTAQLLGDAGRIGETLNGNEIIGIVDDFYFSSLRNGLEPLLFTQSNSAGEYLLINTLNGINDTREIWSSMTEAPFEYNWLEDRFKSLQAKELQIVRLFTSFTGFAVFISLLGLFSLGLFIFEQRKRELGIRKILGAKPWQIIKQFSWSTSRLLIIGFAIACPIAIYGVRYWFRNFAEVIPINLEGLILAAFIAFGSALFAVILQSVYASKINPVETLRNE